MIASPFLPKYLSSPRCAALQGALYLVGDNTKKVYVYDPGANLWQKVGLSLASPGDPPPLRPMTPRRAALGAPGPGVSPQQEDSEGTDEGAESGPSPVRMGELRTGPAGHRGALSPAREGLCSVSSGGASGTAVD